MFEPVSFFVVFSTMLVASLFAGFILAKLCFKDISPLRFILQMFFCLIIIACGISYVVNLSHP